MLRYIRNHLQLRISLAFALVLLIPTAIIAGYAVHTTTDLLLATTADTLLGRHKLETSALESFLGREKSNILFLSRLTDLADYAQARRANDQQQAQLSISEIQTTLLAYAENLRNYDQIRFLDIHGQEIVKVEMRDDKTSMSPEPDLNNVAGMDFFQQASRLANGQVFISKLEQDPELDGSEAPHLTIYFAAPVYSQDNQVIGVLATQVLTDSIFSLLKQDAPSEVDYLIDSNGSYLAGPFFAQAGAQTENMTNNFFVNHPHDGKQILSASEGTLRGSPDAPNTFQVFAQVAPPGEDAIHWTLYHTEPLSRIYDGVNGEQWVIVTLALLALLGAIGVATLIAQNIIQPLHRLSLAAVEIGQGRWDNPIPVYRRKDEIGALTTVFASMTQEIRKTVALQQRAHELEVEKKLAEENVRLKSNFISMVSHEFRTPLTTISLSNGLLETSLQKMSVEQRQKHFGKINIAVKDMVSLLEEVMQVGRFESGSFEFDPKPLDLTALCQELIEEMQAAAPQNKRLTFAVLGDSEPILGDKKLLRQVITNLLSNALKYSPDDKPVELALAWTDSVAEIKVIDRGIGIPEEDQKQLFEPFHRARNVGKIPGTGLGLTIINKAVERHHGSIRVESKAGIGTTFLVTLPIGRSVEGRKGTNIERMASTNRISG